MNLIIDMTPPVFLLLLGIGTGIGWLLWKKRDWKCRFWLILAFLCYVLVLSGMTLFPIYIFDEEMLSSFRRAAGKYFTFYQLVPFASIRNYFSTGAYIQILGNLALLSPMVLFFEIFERQKAKAWQVALAGSGVSLLIEIIQLSCNLITGYPGRIADVDDLLLNVIGVVLTTIILRYIAKNETLRQKLHPILYRK